MHKITGKIQNYDWGGRHFIAEFLGNDAMEATQAEYWLGAHPLAPSMLEHGQSLPQWLQEHPQAQSERSRKRFGGNVPFLLKILDVAKPLSIQVHPSKAQAERGFREEEAKKIPPNAPNRTYKDDNHKPEMMVALSDFWLLHGFLPQSALLERIGRYPSLQEWLPIFEQGGLRGLYEHLLSAEQSALSRWLSPMLDAPIPEDCSSPDYWLHETMRLMQISREQLDAGLTSFYVMNIVHLKQGEGIFQEAGLLHAYLRGQNIELMACSDNVVRGGLTSKYIDKSALAQIVNYVHTVPQIIAPIEEGEFPTPPTDFTLRRQVLQAGQKLSMVAEELSVMLLMEGSLLWDGGRLVRGQSALLSAGERVELWAEVDSWWVVAS